MAHDVLAARAVVLFGTRAHLARGPNRPTASLSLKGFLLPRSRKGTCPDEKIDRGDAALAFRRDLPLRASRSGERCACWVSEASGAEISALSGSTSLAERKNRRFLELGASRSGNFRSRWISEPRGADISAISGCEILAARKISFPLELRASGRGKIRADWVPEPRGAGGSPSAGSQSLAVRRDSLRLTVRGSRRPPDRSRRIAERSRATRRVGRASPESARQVQPPVAGGRAGAPRRAGHRA